MENSATAVPFVGTVTKEHCCLDAVMSVSEAAELYGKHRKSVLYHMKAGHIQYRQMDDTYLLLKSDIDKFWKVRVK